jgi:ATP phosphoribosyltransferase
MIVDIVDTGNTLRANGMEPRDEIARVTSRLIVNKAAQRSHHDAIDALVRDIGDAVAEAAA